MFQVILRSIVSFFMAVAAIFTPASAEPTMPLVNVNPNPIKAEVLSQDLTVMTYNIKCSGEGKYSQESRKDAVCSLVNKYSPDSLGVQEADKSWIGLLSGTLTEYANVGTYRDDGISEGESNNIFYKKDKYELVDSGDFWLSKHPRFLQRIGMRVVTESALMQFLKTKPQALFMLISTLILTTSATLHRRNLLQ